jgi:hypothetical protein
MANLGDVNRFLVLPSRRVRPASGIGAASLLADRVLRSVFSGWRAIFPAV